jgi:hypothetical protein
LTIQPCFRVSKMVTAQSLVPEKALPHRHPHFLVTVEGIGMTTSSISNSFTLLVTLVIPNFTSLQRHPINISGLLSPPTTQAVINDPNPLRKRHRLSATPLSAVMFPWPRTWALCLRGLLRRHSTVAISQYIRPIQPCVHPSHLQPRHLGEALTTTFGRSERRILH